MKVFKQKAIMLKLFVYASLNCVTAKKIFIQVVITKGMYTTLRDAISKVLTSQCIKLFLGPL